MNEATQIEAMRAELVAQGYEVHVDVLAASIGLPELEGLGDFVADLIGVRLNALNPKARWPHEILIVEVTNRQQRPDPHTRRGFPARGIVSDQEALARFSKIANSIRNQPWIEFEIRFLDVSADQVAARKLKPGSAAGREKLRQRFLRDTEALASVQNAPMLVRATIVARLWANWLRVAAYRFPGRQRMELKTADLRIIQKDLYDHGVLDMPPREYRALHDAVLSVTEGGDVECERLLKLEAPLQALWSWMAQKIDFKILEAPSPKDADLLRRLDIAITQLGPRVPPAVQADLALLRFTQRTDRFASAVAQFQRHLGPHRLPENLLDELLAEAAKPWSD
ncbi:hypothetical protein [Brevundimonas naejangsanensis]